MAGRDREVALLQELNRHEILRLRGYAFGLGPKGGVTVDRWGHVRGVWTHDGDRFAWTPASRGEPVHWSDDEAAAVRYTLVTLAID